jgi:integrase
MSEAKKNFYGVFQTDSKRHGKCWAFQLTWYDSKGERNRKTKAGFRTKGQAEEFAEALMKKALLEKYEIADPQDKKVVKPVTVHEAIEEYLEYRKDKVANRKKAANPHARHFRSSENKLFEWEKQIGADREIKTITQHDLVSWIAHEKRRGTVTSTSISRSLNTIRACLAFIAERREELSAWRVPKKPPVPGSNVGRSRPLEDEEIKALAEVLASDEEYRDLYDFFRIALGSASRVDEIISLRWSDIDFENKIIKLFASKTQKEKILQLPSVVALIDKRRQDGKGDKEFVFTCRDHWLRRMLKKAAGAAKIPYGKQTENGFVIHDLRGTALSNLLNAGVDPIVVSKVYASHHSLQQTNVYLNPTKKRLTVGSEVADKLVDLATVE